MKQKISAILLLLGFVAVCMIVPAVLPLWFYRGIVLLLLFSILALLGSIVKSKS
ncbi:MAG: hypothetical protein IKQ37_05590 [Bacteroidaceae bacterium]|nr:hypothetical protein [Bacteroidaceae bacterium]